MTVAVGNGRSTVWDADGVNRTWAFPFKAFKADHLRLAITDTNGITTETAGPFTVTGLGLDAGGSVTYPIAPTAPLPAGYTVQVLRRVPLSQPNRIGNQGGFHAGTHEDTFDLLAMQIQDTHQELVETTLDSVTLVDRVESLESTAVGQGGELGAHDGRIEALEADVQDHETRLTTVENSNGVGPSPREVTISGRLQPNSIGSYFDGDNRFVDQRHVTIAPDADISRLDDPYFNYTTYPHFVRLETKSSQSGTDAHLNGAIIAGSSFITLDDVTPWLQRDATTGAVIGAGTLDPGAQILIDPYGTNPERRTVTSINTATKVIGINTPTTYAHSNGVAVRRYSRQFGAAFMAESTVYGPYTGGDHNLYGGRMVGGASVQFAGRNIDEAVSAVFMGGDVTAISDKVYLEGTEITLMAGAYLCSGFGDVRSYVRNNPSTASRAYWVGNIQKSEGTAYADAIWVGSGKWKRGLDLGGAMDLGAELAAIVMGNGFRTYYGASRTTGSLYSDALTGTYTDASDSGTRYWRAVLNNIEALKVQETRAFFAKDIIAQGANAQITVPQGGSVRFNGADGNVMIFYNGTNLIASKNGTNVNIV